MTVIQNIPNSLCKGLNTFSKNYLQNCKRCLTFFYELCGIICKKIEIMKGYERATKEEINDRLRIEENCHAQVERIIYIRHLCNLNLEEAADVTNLSISTLSRYENEVTKCSVQSLITIYYHYQKYLYEQHIPFDRSLFLIDMNTLDN